MRTFTTLLIGCSLALAGAAMAQQPEEQSTPKNKTQGTEKTHRAEAKPEKTLAKPEPTVAKTHGARKERAGLKEQNLEATPKSEKSTHTGTNVSGEPVATATPGGNHQTEQGKRGMKERAVTGNEKTLPSATPTTSENAAGAVSTTNERHGRGKGEFADKKKPAPAQLQQIKEQHTNFHAQPKPDRAPAVTFNANYRIQGSDRWQGPQYEAFRSYHPERHDQGWYRSHYNRVELIGGGYYYWHDGYWYPAWGYDPSAEYYAYDGPIYVGHRAEPPDQVIADVQSELQEMGYYQGEVDGLLGPLTRQALTDYQSEHGLADTAAIDEPTLDSLGMG